MTEPPIPVRSFYHIPASGIPASLPDLDAALSALKGEGYIWLNFLNPGREDLAALSGPLGLHPLAVEDCLDEKQIPKIEDYPTNTFVLFNMFYYADRSLAVDEIDLFIGKNFLVIACQNLHGRPRFLERLLEVAILNAKNIGKGPDYLLHEVMDYIVDQKFHAVEAFQEEIERLEETILDSISSFRPRDLMVLRKNLLALRKSIIHEREILVKICRRDSPFISDKSIFDFRDIYDHLAKFYEEAEIFREMISNLMEMYLSTMNNRMSMLANRTNMVVRRLTFITTIFMPLTLIAGIGGMSEWSMMTGPHNWKIAYPLFFLLMVAVGIVNYLLLKKLESQDKKRKD
jgi:magnesium transporter